MGPALPRASQLRRPRCGGRRAALLAIASLQLASAAGCRSDQPPEEEAAATAEALLARDIEPADSAVVHGTEAWIRWRSDVPADERVLWRRAGERRFRAEAAAPAETGGARRAQLGPLETGATYEFLVESVVEGTVHRSPARTFTVGDGLGFEPAVVTQAVPRDYDQSVPLTFRLLVRGSGDELYRAHDAAGAQLIAARLNEPLDLLPGSYRVQVGERRLPVLIDAARQTVVDPATD